MQEGIEMKKSLYLAVAALAALALSSCATTSGAASSSSGFSGKNQNEPSSGLSETTKKAAINALTGAGKNTWFKKTSGNYVYYILYSDTSIASGVRSDVVINKGLTILATTSSENPVNGLTSKSFAVKSFGQTATESADGSSQTFTLNDGAWSYFYAKNSASMTALSSLPEQLKAENALRYTNATSLSAKDFNWKQILINYLEGTL